MSIPFTGQLEARRDAPLHLQLQLTPQATKTSASGCEDVLIEGRAVRIFRGETLINMGDAVSFRILSCPKADGPPTGPAYVYREDLATATHAEVFLYGTPPNCRLADYEIALLQGPSVEPRLTLAQLELLLVEWNASARSPSRPKRWWHLLGR